MSGRDTVVDAYADFVRDRGPGLKHALTASFGPEIGMEAASEALTYGWEHWDRVSSMENPGGYLYRVGQNWGKRRLRTKLPSVWFPQVALETPWVEPGLAAALGRLSQRQRTAVLLVHGAGWSLAETAAFMGVSRGAVDKHVNRALTRLRRLLEVTHVT